MTTAFEKAAALKTQALRDEASRQRQAVMSAAVAFAIAHPDVVTWIGDHATTDTFAGSLARQLDERGALTDRQIEAARAAAVRAVERAAQKAPAPAVEVERIEQAFARANAAGIEKPAMRLDAFKFKSAGDTGRNPGAIYVTEEGQYLGKITGGRFSRSAECTPEQEARIVRAAADPQAAAEAYGQRTGCCSVCGLKLTAQESIARTIGPICFEKYFG